MTDLFSPPPKKPKDPEPAPIAPHIAAAARYSAPYVCAICGAPASFGRGLPHKGERVQYFCAQHKDATK